MTPVEKVAEDLKKEAKRLCPPAFVKVSADPAHDREATVYIYAPRKFADMLQDRLKTLRTQLLKTTPNLNVRIMMDDMENMSPQLKEQYAKEQQGA